MPRKSKLNKRDIKKIHSLRKKGEKLKDIANGLVIGIGTVSRVLNGEGCYAPEAK